MARTHYWPDMDDDGRIRDRSPVSSIYRWGRSDGPISPAEGERRLRRAMQRLVTDRGRETVAQTLRAAEVRREQQLTRAWLVLTAEATRDGQLGGTL